DEVDLWNFFQNFAAITLRKTSGNHQFFAVALRFQIRHFQDRLDGFLFGAIDEPARVHDDDVRIFFLSGDGITLPAEGSKHNFAVYQVLWTAKADEPDLRHLLFRHF